MSSERDHIVNLNEDLSLRIVEFEVSVKEMNSQMQSLQVIGFYHRYLTVKITQLMNIDRFRKTA